MGSIVSWLIGGNNGRTDDPDPVTKLTSRDIYLIQNSWIPIRKQLTKTGVDILLELFEKFPAEKQHFPFKHLTNEQLANDKKFHAHCNSIMHNFDAIVDNIANIELLTEILNKIGENHKRRHVKSQSFWNIKVVIVDKFEKIMSKEALKAWEQALDVVFEIINKNL